MNFLEIILYLLLACFIIFGSYAFIFVISSFSPLKRIDNNFKPKVSVIIPCRNEEDVIENTLNSVKNQDYNDFEVIVVDDNSSDKTAEIIEKFIDSNKLSNFKLLKRKEENSKKAKAVNNALRYVKGDIIVFFDADNRPENKCISNLVKGFSNDKIAAVQGRIVTNVTNFVSRIVFMERCSGFNVRFLGRERLWLNCQFGGTAVAIKTKILKSMGGFNEDTLTEDTYLTSNLIYNGYKIVYQPSAIVNEEAPPNIHNYITQRTRWASGHMKCFFEHFLRILKAPISLKDKIDTVLFLAYYFVPVLCGIAILIGLISLHLNVKLVDSSLSTISIVLSLIPFLEIGVGVLRSEKKINLYLIPALAFFFILNVLICFIAISNILKGNNFWVKTERINTGRKMGKGTHVTMFSSLLVCALVFGSFGSTILEPLSASFAEKSDYTSSNITDVALNSGQIITKKINSNHIITNSSKHEVYKNQMKITSNWNNIKSNNSKLNQTDNTTVV